MSAANLLSLMSFFDRQGISENLLRAQYERQDQYLTSKNTTDDSSDEDMDSLSETDPDQDFEDDITTLRDYSFISVASDRTVFTMHRLVQLSARRWLKAHDQIQQWKEKFISNLCQEFPTGEYENWERCRSLYPHVKSAMSQLPESQDSLRQWVITPLTQQHGYLVDRYMIYDADYCVSMMLIINYRIRRKNATSFLTLSYAPMIISDFSMIFCLFHENINTACFHS
jgi:hypothetical protein